MIIIYKKNINIFWYFRNIFKVIIFYFIIFFIYFK